MTTKKTLNTLTPQDLEEIRKCLPYSWRLQICQANPGLTARNVTETFYLRTRNSQWTTTVFGAIVKTLRKQNKKELASKCLHRIRMCRSIQLDAVA